MRASIVRDLLARTAVHLVVAAVFFAPLGTVGLSGGIVAPPAIPFLDEPEGEPFGDARFLHLPDPGEHVEAAEEELPAEAGEEEGDDDTVAPEVEPVLPARAEAEVEAAGGGSARATLVDGGPEPTTEGGDGGEGTGDDAVRGDGRGRKRPVSSRPPRGRKKNCDKPHPNVRHGNDGVVEIDRALVAHYTHNLESFMKLGYSRPYDEGSVHGWYVSGFSCASPVSKAGFERGDVLLAVNGKKTRSWVGVFMLYQKLKKKDDFTVELVRRGEPVTLRFRVVEGGPFSG